MARDLESLVVSLDADITRLTKQLAKAGVSLDDFGKTADKKADAAKKAINKHLGDEAGSSGGLNFNQIQELGHAARATFESLAAGASPLRVLAQEGVKASAAIGPGGLSGLAKQLGTSLGSVITPAGLAAGSILAAGAAAVYAYSEYEDAQQAIKLGLSGIGQASHATIGDIENIGDKVAATSRISVGAAKEIATAIAATGKVDVSRIAGIANLARGYGVLTGKSTSEAGQDLAKIFADPAKGAETLNARLGALDGATLHYIQRLTEAGDTERAIDVLRNAVQPDIQKAADNVGTLARAYERLKAGASGAVEAVGAGVASAVDPTKEDRLADLKKRRAEQQQTGDRTDLLADAFGRLGSSKGGVPGKGAVALDLPVTVGAANGTEGLDAEIKKLEEEIAKEKQLAKIEADRRKANLQSDAAAPAVEEADPLLAQIEQLEARIKLVRTDIRNAQNGLVLPEAGGFDHEVDAANALEEKLKQLKAEYAQGGTAAAAALRQADFSRATAGLSAYSRGLAEINFQYDEQVRKAATAVNSAAAIATAGKEADDKRAALTTQYLAQPSQYSHSINDVPEQYRPLVLAAAQKNAVDPNLLASLGFAESSFVNGQTSKTGNKGLFQLGPGVIKDYGVTDTSDPAQNINAGAAYLASLLKKYNQNVPQAIAGYNFGPGNTDATLARGGQFPKETTDEIAKITQRTADLKQVADTTRDWDRANVDAKRTLGDLQTNLGKSNQGLAEAQERQRLENEALKAGIPLTDDLKKSIAARAAATAQLGQSMAAVRLESQLTTQKQDLGLSPGEAEVAARLRAANIDPASAEGKKLADQVRELQTLTQAKDTGTTFAKSLTNDLIAGASAADALKSAVTRLLTSLADNAIDSLASTIFKAGTAGTGGGLFGSLLGALKFAGGGRVVGPGTGTSDSIPALLSHGEFVVNADASRKYGSLLHAVNSGAIKRFAAGGSVGLPAIPNAAVPANDRGGAAITHAPTYNITPADGVTPAQLRAVLERHDKQISRTIGTRMAGWNRRYG